MPFLGPVIADINGATATLIEPLVYRGRHQVFVIPEGFVTDFASVPRFMTWLIPTMGAYTRGAVLHDWLCTQLEEHRSSPRYDDGVLVVHRRNGPPASARDTDGVFRRVCREADTPLIRRWLLWCGVRWGALFNPARRAGWWRDAPAVVGISLLALPFLLLPALLVGLVLLVDTVVERIR